MRSKVVLPARPRQFVRKEDSGGWRLAEVLYVDDAGDYVLEDAVRQEVDPETGKETGNYLIFKLAPSELALWEIVDVDRGGANGDAAPAAG